MRLLSRMNLECHVAPKEEGRYSIAGLYCGSHGVYSTDGRMLMVTPYPGESPEDFPMQSTVAPFDTDDKPALLPGKQVKKALGLLPKSSNIAVLENALLESGSSGGKRMFRLTMNDLDSEVGVQGEQLETEFPDMGPPMEACAKADQHFTLTIELWMQMLTVLKKAGAQHVRVGFQSSAWAKEGPMKGEWSEVIAVDCGADAGELPRGCIMPVNP